MAVVVVVNQLKDFQAEIPGVEVVTVKDYLSDPSCIKIKSARVFNLCRSFRYQSAGYYISLLAAARGHKVMPDITTIQDTKTQSIIRLKSEEMDELIQKTLEGIKGKEFTLDIYFGKCIDAKYQALALQLFHQFQVPLLRAFFEKRGKKWYLQDVDPISSKALQAEDQQSMVEYATDFFNNKRQKIKKPTFFPYEMAILVNPEEEQPPSNKKAIKKFIKAAESLGIGAWTITKDDYHKIGEYDALFIRETTNVNHHTYRFARKAAVEGLVVIDDPESILRCSNKVYLAELLERHNIPTPKTMVISKDNVDEIPKNFKFPFILKLPDSCFSQGVVKVKSQKELEEKSKAMLDKSELIIAQEFLPTDYDWRIGIFDRKPIYACKYYMAGKHWQIINRGKDGNLLEGKHETFDIKDVPQEVIQTALKAANLIGSGLYGVDLKQIDGRCFIIEVNDNPNIDAGVEDEVLKDELYLNIIQVFLDRIQTLKSGVRQ